MTEMANIVAKLAEKTDTKMAGKYGGVEHPPPFILGLAITLETEIVPWFLRTSWKLIYHFDFSLLFEMNFIHVLASYIHTSDLF